MGELSPTSGLHIVNMQSRLLGSPRCLPIGGAKENRKLLFWIGRKISPLDYLTFYLTAPKSLLLNVFWREKLKLSFQLRLYLSDSI